MGSSRIYVARSDGTGANPLTKSSSSSFEPWFSPSGKRITFSSDRATGAHFDGYVMNADGSRQRGVTPTTSSSYPSGWGIQP